MKPRALICAYACLGAPDKRFNSSDGGEGELGWNAVLQISRFCDVLVLTHKQNQQFIESKLVQALAPSLKFYYIGLPRALDFLQKIGGGVQLYAYLWQIKAYFVAKKLHKKINFNLFQHITFANDWMASFIGALLPVLYIRGPGGGAHKVPKAFLKEYSPKERAAERLRSFGQFLYRHDPFFVIGQNKAKAILVCNKEAFLALKKGWKEKAEFFPVNGVSNKDLSLPQVKRADNKFRVITAGRLINIKNFDLAIKAFDIFSKKNPNSSFTVVGDGPELEKLIRLSRALHANVNFEKWIPREALLQKIAESDVFIFPSLRDGGGQVVVEAMAMGKPVVCFNISGPGCHVDQTCGIKIKPDNPTQAVEDFADALNKLFVDNNLRVKLGKGAREKAEKQYSWDMLGEKLKKIYFNLL